MNGTLLGVTSDAKRVTRRQLMRGGAGLAGIAAFGRGVAPARAQELTGEITVQFEARGGMLENEVNAIIADITGKHPGAKISVAEPVVGDYITGVTLPLMSGEGADVFSMNSIAIAQLGESGMVAPLDDWIAGWEEWPQFIEPYKQYLPYHGQTFALPYSMDTHFLYYRPELFAQAGLPTPWEPKTLDDLLNAARALKGSLPADVIPYVLYAGKNPGNSTAVRGFLPLLYANGGALKDEAGKWIIDSPAIRASFAFYELVYQTEQLIPRTVLSTPGVANAMRQQFAMGKVGILFDGCWVWDDWTKFVAPDKIGYGLHPANGRDPFTVGGFGNGWFVNAQSKSPDLAWAFVAGMLGAGPVTRLNLDDPHVPPRADSAADPGFAEGFNRAMVESIDAAVLITPEPEFAELVEIIQNATGAVATGEVEAGAAADTYRSELERVLGKENTTTAS